MGLQNLNRILDRYDSQLGISEVSQLSSLKGLPFYNWSASEKFANSSEDFNHAIGLPLKAGVAYPLFDYEQLIFNELQQNKHLWIKKATGLGITEFMLRYMAWLCLNNNQFEGSQMCIVTGPRIELAITLINRMKGLFSKDSLLTRFDTKETVIELNGVHIEAYPSHHLDAMRGLDKVAFIY